MMAGPFPIKSEVTVRVPRWQKVVDDSAMSADVDVGRFNSIMNRSGAAWASIAIEHDDGTQEEIENVQPGELIPVAGVKIILTGMNEAGDAIATDTGVRKVLIGRF